MYNIYKYFNINFQFSEHIFLFQIFNTFIHIYIYINFHFLFKKNKNIFYIQFLIK